MNSTLTLTFGQAVPEGVAVAAAQDVMGDLNSAREPTEEEQAGGFAAAKAAMDAYRPVASSESASAPPDAITSDLLRQVPRAT